MIQTRIARRGFLTIGTMAAVGGLMAPAVLRAQTATLADTLAGDARFSRFLQLITEASMVEDFRAAQPMTVFAPTTVAFNSAPAGILNSLSGNNGSGQNRGSVDRAGLMALINYHVLPGAFRAAQLMGTDRRLRTRNGSDISITGNADGVMLKNPSPGTQLGGLGAGGLNLSASPIKVVQADILASNGIIHAIDGVLFP